MSSAIKWLAAGVTGLALLGAQAASAQEMGTAGGAAGTPATPPRFGGVQRTTGQAAAYEPPPPIRAGQPISVLFFPFAYSGDVPAGDAAMPVNSYPELRHLVSAHVKAGFLSSPSFALATFHGQSSLVQKGQKDGILLAEHLNGLVTAGTGVVDIAKAKMVAHRLGIQTVLVGGLEVAKSGANQLEVTVDGQLINSTTGEILRQSTLSAAAAGAEGVPMTAVVDRAGTDAAAKLLTALGLELVRPAPAAAPAQKGRKREPKKAEPKKRAEVEQPKDESPAAADRDAARRARAEKEAAEKEAARQARAEKQAAERTARDARRAAERARRDNGRTAQTPVAAAPSRASEGTPLPTAAVAGEDGSKAPVVARDEPAGAGPALALGAGAAPAAPRSTFRGSANAEGQAIPYGYAIGEQTELPKRQRSGLKVPTWVGVAAFITGLSFLL